MTMAIQRRPPRSVADLRTQSGRSDIRTAAHKAYLRISFLELERARKMQELRNYRDRLDAIRDRFREIDVEVAKIRLDLDSPGPRAQAVPAAQRQAIGRPLKTRIFQFSY